MPSENKLNESRPPDSKSAENLSGQIAEVILGHQPELRRDCRGVTQIKIPLCGVREAEREYVPINSERLRGELSLVIHEKLGRLLTIYETTRLVQLLAGYAGRQPVPHPTREEFFEAEPWAEAIEIFLRSPESGGSFDGTASTLYDTLTKIKDVERLAGDKRDWPKDAPRLGRKLKQHEEQLHHVGLSLHRDQTSHRRGITLTLMTVDDSSKSAVDEADCLVENQSTTGNDASDTYLKDVFATIKTKETEDDYAS